MLAINPDVNIYRDTFRNVKSNHILLQVNLSKIVEFDVTIGGNATANVGAKSDCRSTGKCHFGISLTTMSINGNTHTPQPVPLQLMKMPLSEP